MPIRSTTNCATKLLPVRVAELIRQRVDRGGTRVKRPGDPLAKVEGIIRDGRLSERLDEELCSR